MAKGSTIFDEPLYHDFCLRYRDNLVRYVAEHSRHKPTWQQLQMFRACSKPGCRVAVSSGHGCFGLGTEVLMYDGTVKRVEDVVLGDLLMGDDCTPRQVFELKRGREEMYEFELVDGTKYRFNKSHILCLVASQTHGRQTRGDKIEVTVGEYLSWSERRRRTNIFYRTGCSFVTASRLLIPPYILGTWLGDGTGIAPSITNPDPEVLAEWERYARDCGYVIKYSFNTSNCPIVSVSNNFQRDGLRGKLNEIGVFGNKHIPHAYKTASRQDRLDLLAGLLDTDGTVDNRRGSVFEITQKNQILANDIVYLARSLGMHATIHRVRKKCCNNGVEGEYFRISITRNIDCIPLRVSRKKPNAERDKQRDCLNFGIRSIVSLGVGDYYGFTISGNGRFLGADFTVLHNTGKSFCLSWILDWNLRVFPHSNAVLTANNVEQVRSVTWKYLETTCADVEKVHPWMRDKFILETKRYYAAGFKNSWYVLAKTASKSNPEGLAGQHNRNLMFVIDEASGVDDSIIEVVTGALTEDRNRLIMTSQPTRPGGKFADAMLKLSKDAGKKEEDRIYDAIWMNSEESPIVTRKYIREKLIEYGGHHSPEYQIRVLGHFPDNMEGYLIPRHWCVDCQQARVEHREEWGWVLCCDVAEGLHRDSSVATLFKISGAYSNRVVETVWCEEFLGLNEKEFGRFIQSKYREYPALTVVVDGDGAGRTVILDLEEQGVPVQPIHWGLPPHTEADRRRYFNLRAYAHYKLREAIFEGRFRGPAKQKFVEQASRLPYKIDERGRYQMESKDRMRAEGIKSPDISDTCCFAFLADYIPVGQGGGVDEERDEFLKMARAALGEDME